MSRKAKKPLPTIALREPKNIQLEHVVFADEGEMVNLVLQAEDVQLYVYFTPEQFKALFDRVTLFALERTEALQ